MLMRETTCTRERKRETLCVETLEAMDDGLNNIFYCQSLQKSYAFTLSLKSCLRWINENSMLILRFRECRVQFDVYGWIVSPRLHYFFEQRAQRLLPTQLIPVHIVLLQIIAQSILRSDAILAKDSLNFCTYLRKQRLWHAIAYNIEGNKT